MFTEIFSVCHVTAHKPIIFEIAGDNDDLATKMNGKIITPNINVISVTFHPFQIQTTFSKIRLLTNKTNN